MTKKKRPWRRERPPAKLDNLDPQRLRKGMAAIRDLIDYPLARLKADYVLAPPSIRRSTRRHK